MTKKPAASPDAPASYGVAVQQLEQLVAELESGQLPLEELLAQYQRGTALLRYCRGCLQALEQQVRELGEGGALQPWAPE